jgi:hypothetical protein
MLTDAFRVPLAAGVNVTVIVQLAPPAMLVPQVLVCEKSPAFVPAILMPVKFNCPVPTFVRVTFPGTLVVPTGWLPKDNAFLERLTAVPTPVNGIACGLAGSESLMTSTPALLSFAVGVKVTEIVQIPAGASEPGQLGVTAKSPEFVPAM